MSLWRHFCNVYDVNYIMHDVMYDITDVMAISKNHTQLDWFSMMMLVFIVGCMFRGEISLF